MITTAPNLKVPLKLNGFDLNPRLEATPLLRALPWFKSTRGTYTHRVRSGNVYWRGGEYRHTAIHFWCGNTGFTSSGQLLAERVTEPCLYCEAKYRAAHERHNPAAMRATVERDLARVQKRLREIENAEAQLLAPSPASPPSSASRETPHDGNGNGGGN